MGWSALSLSRAHTSIGPWASPEYIPRACRCSFSVLADPGRRTAGAQPCSCRAEMGLPLLRVKPGYTACIGCGSASLSDERFGRKDWWNGSAVAIS